LRSVRCEYRAHRLLFVVRVCSSGDRVCSAYHHQTTRRHPCGKLADDHRRTPLALDVTIGDSLRFKNTLFKNGSIQRKKMPPHHHVLADDIFLFG